MFDAYFYRGRVGLAEILTALGVGHGDTVAMQAFTCVAVPEAVFSVGAKPLFVDLSEGGVNMSPVSLAERLTSDVKAIVVQHTFGIPCDIVAICQTASKWGVPVVEDCCHTYTSKYAGELTGKFGCASFYSFEWGKPLVAGIGGGVVCKDPRILLRVRKRLKQMTAPPILSVAKIELQYLAFHLFLRPRSYWRLKRLFRRLSKSGTVVGNYNDISSGRARSFDWRMSRWHSRRVRNVNKLAAAHEKQSNQIASLYRQIIGQSSRLRLVAEPREATSVYARFPVFASDKKQLLLRAEQNGVEIADWYISPVHPLQGPELNAAGYAPGSCPNAESACRQIVSFPVSAKVDSAYFAMLQPLVI